MDLELTPGVYRATPPCTPGNHSNLASTPYSKRQKNEPAQALDSTRVRMCSAYVDLAALRRLLWSAAVVSAPESHLLTLLQSHQCSILNHTAWPPPLPSLLCAWLALLLEVMNLALHASYLTLRVGVPPIQLPPVVRSSRRPLHRAVLMLSLAVAALALCVLSCSAWLLHAAALMIGMHACLLLVPCFGQPWYWRLHYWGMTAFSLGGAHGRFDAGEDEEWFCSAEMAARAVMAHLPAVREPPAAGDVTAGHVLVLGNGLSALPELLAGRCERVSAVDSSLAAVLAMRRRCERVEWSVADVGRLGFASRSIDVVVDKGTFAALLEKSTAVWAAGFAEARRVLRPGGVLVTVALVAVPAKRLQAAGFELLSSYRLPLSGPTAQAGCSVFPRAYVQVARRQLRVEGEDAEAGESAPDTEPRDETLVFMQGDEDAEEADDALPLLAPLPRRP